MIDVIDFLRKKGKHFRPGMIENAAKIQKGMLSRVVNGEPSRNITPEQKTAVMNYLKRLHSSLSDFLKSNNNI